MTVLIAILAALYTFTPLVDRAILKVLNRLSGETIQIDYRAISGNLFGTIRIDSLEVRTPDHRLRCVRAEIDYSLLDVLKGRYRVGQLLLVEPAAVLDFSQPDSLAPPGSAARPIDSLLADLKLGNLPDVQINRLLVQDGDIQVLTPQETEQFQDLQLSLSAAVSPQHIDLQPQYLRGNWRNRDLKIDDLSFRLTGNQQRLTVNQVNARIPGVYFAGKGEIEFEPAFRVLFFPDSLRTDLKVVHAFYPAFPFQSGYLTAGGHLMTEPGKLGEFRGSLKLGAELDSLHIRSLRLDYRKTADELLLGDIALRSNLGTCSGSARIAPQGINQVQLNFREFDPSRAGLLQTPLSLSGRLNFNFREWNIDQMEGEGRLELFNLQLADARAERVQLNLGLQQGDWEIRQPSTLRFGEGALFTLAGHVSRDQNVDLRLTSEGTNLDTLMQRLALSELGGYNGSVDLHITGPLRDPSVQGNIDISQITYRGEKVELSGISGKADIAHVLNRSNTRFGSFDLTVGTGYFGNLFLTNGRVNLLFSQNRIVANPFLFYSREDSITGRAYISLQDSLTDIALTNLEVFFDRYTVRSDSIITARWKADTLFVDAFSMTAGDSGSISSRGFLAFEGSSALSGEIRNTRIDPFNERLLWQHDLRGMLDGQWDLYGELDNPEIDLQLFLKALSFDNYPIGKITSDLSLKDGGLQINVFDLESGKDSYLTVNGSMDIQLFGEEDARKSLKDTPLNLNVVLGNFRLEDYGFLYQTQYPLSGSLTGRLDLAGTLGNPAGTLEISGDSLRYGDYKFPYLSAVSRIAPERLSLEQATVNFLNTEVHLSGEKRLRWQEVEFDSSFAERLLADKNFRLSIEIDEDSLNFLNVLNPELESLIGDIRVSAELAGDYDHPRFTRGNIQVVNGTLYLAKYENALSDINFTGHLSGDSLLIDQMQARSPRKTSGRSFLRRWFAKVQRWFFTPQENGDITGSGYVVLSEIDRPKLDLSIKMRDAYFNNFIENVAITASSGNLRIQGRDTIAVTGDVLVKAGTVLIDFEEQEKNLLLATDVRESPPYLQYNLNLEILPNFNIRSEDLLNSFDMQIAGNLRILQEPKALPEMYGVLETSGKYYIQGQDFDIESGRINFANPKELPELNLVARKERNNLIFNLNVRGKLDNPEKEIVIQDENGQTLPYVDVKDQMALLLFGVTFNDLGSGTASRIANTGGEAVTQIMISRIEAEARTFTGLDRIRLDTQESFFTNRLNQPSSLSLGKYLTPKLYLEYKSRLSSSGLGGVPAPSLSWEAGNRIYLQYRLNRTWSFSTFYENTEEGNGKVKFDINWQIGF